MSSPIIFLSRPSLSENIGSCARAMLNFGFRALRLIAPQCDHVNAKARALCAGADEVLEAAQVFPSLQEATWDIHYLYATTARPRGMIKPVSTLKDAATACRGKQSGQQRCGILFGAEKSGLSNEEITQCNEIITAPLNKEFSSLNLAQCVVLWCYEYAQTALQELARPWEAHEPDDGPAARQEVQRFLEQLDAALTTAGYYRHADKRPLMQRGLHNIFTNAPLSQQQVRTLRGVVSAFEYGMRNGLGRESAERNRG